MKSGYFAATKLKPAGACRVQKHLDAMRKKIVK
jgi:hypothetical protein